MFEKDKEYLDFINAMSLNYKYFQIKASLKINSEMLKFYFLVGKGICELSNKSTYGKGLIESISKDLKSKLPSLDGLSITNLRYMKRFYEIFSDLEIHPQLGGGSLRNEINPQLGGESIELKDLIFSTPWGHIKYLLDRCEGNKNKILWVPLII